MKNINYVPPLRPRRNLTAGKGYNALELVIKCTQFPTQSLTQVDSHRDPDYLIKRILHLGIYECTLCSEMSFLEKYDDKGNRSLSLLWVPCGTTPLGLLWGLLPKG